MKTLHRYLLAESLGPFIIGLFTFSLVVLLQRFSRLADLAIAKGVPLRLVGRLLLSLFPTFLEIILPAALLLAILLALGRIGSDSETTAMASAGIGMRGLLPPVLLLCVAVFSGSLFIGWSGIPWGTRHLQETIARMISMRAGAGASEHAFQEIAPDVLLYPDRVSPDGTRMSGILLADRMEGKDPLLIFAREGEFMPERGGKAASVSLSDGAIHHEDTHAGSYRVAYFRGMEFILPTGLGAAFDLDDPKRLTIPELSSRSATPLDDARGGAYRYHLHRRLSLAASCVAFGLFALPLGLFQRARGKSPAFAVTVAMIIFFYFFLAVGGAMKSRAPGVMVLLLWMPNALVMAAACWLLWRSENRVISLPDFVRRVVEKR